MKIVYFDCFSGISGGMALGALVDAGANIEYIEEEIKKLPIEPFTFYKNKVVKRGISALKLDVVLDPDIPIIYREYTEIIKMIEKSNLTVRVKENAKKIFEKIGKAEAKIHHIPLEKVYFHEAGVVDSIVHIIGVCLALEDLGIEQIFTSPIPLGIGQIEIEHGFYPIPTPVTLEIIKGIPIYSSNINSEMTNVTGAGIIAALAANFEGYPAMTIEAIGYGAGTKDFLDRPNVLRAVIGTVDELTLSKPHFHLHEHESERVHHDHHQNKNSN